MLCGDESNAVVFDIGSATTRVGTAGQDCPYHVFRSDIGDLYLEDGAKKKIIGDSALRIIRDNIETRRLGDNGTEAWDDVEKLMTYGFERMRLDPQNYAAMFGQGQFFRDAKSQQKLLEISFESVQTFAAFTLPNGLLNSISAGRPTSLVVDSSSSGTTITPVIDGYELKRARIFTPIGGSMLDAYISKYIEDERKVVIKPWFMTTKYSRFDTTQYDRFSPSFISMHYRDLIQDIKQWTSFIPYNRLASEFRSDEGIVAAGVMIPSPYQLPDGTLLSSNYELLTMPERLFFPEKASNNVVPPAPVDQSPNLTYPSGTSAASNSRKRARELIDIDRQNNIYGTFDQTSPPSSKAVNYSEEALSDLVYLSIAKADVDTRKELLNNIIVCGGSSLIPGFSQRLGKELSEIVPSHLKTKVICNLPIERLHSVWIGGSIISICGTFNQMWVSKKEYEEYGDSIIQKRFIY